VLLVAGAVVAALTTGQVRTASPVDVRP